MIEIKVEKIIGEDGESIFKATPDKISIGGVLASHVDKIHITIPDEWKGCVVRATFVPRYSVPVARLIDEDGYLDLTRDLTIRSRGSLVIDAQNGDYSAYSTDIEYTAYDHQRAGTASGKPSPNEYEQMISIAKSAVKSVNNVLPDQNGNVNVDAQQVQQVQSDWNQNDETAADYVKNRPFYTGNPVETIFVEESTVSFATSGGYYMAQFQSTFSATVGKIYNVSWDGTVYECTCADFNGYPVIGNLSIPGAGSDTGEPFLMIVANGSAIEIYTADTSASHTFSISVFAQEVVKIDEKYLPMSTDDSYGVIKKSDIVSAYNFPQDAPHDQMVEAISAFRTGNASIVWHGNKVIHAYYYQPDDTITVTFAHAPLNTLTFSNNKGSYVQTLGTVTYGELQGSAVRIVNSNNSNVYAVLSVEGDSANKNLNVTGERISINGVYGISTTEIILKSSTTNSRKNFKITVDDTGTISATEVT